MEYESIMTAKRVSVILSEIAEHIRTHGSVPTEWRFELLGSAESIGRQVARGGAGKIFEAYSARDAHDVECALLKMGCACLAAGDESSQTFIWIERSTVPADPSKLSDPVSLPRT
jgi:hypothetical protein